MSRPQPKLADERVLIEHQSSDGPMVTHVRGIVLANSLANLKRVGVYDDYTRHIRAHDLEVVLGALAASWVPAEHVVAHYTACDVLGLPRATFETFGAAAAAKVSSTFMGLFLARARRWGVDAMRASIMHLPRLNERLYKGGGCTVIELGPKEFHVEDHGLPFAACRAYREGYLAFNQAIAALFCKVVYVKLVRPRVPDPQRLAIAVSWV